MKNTNSHGSMKRLHGYHRDCKRKVEKIMKVTKKVGRRSLIAASGLDV
jgi:hypothetical protein